MALKRPHQAHEQAPAARRALAWLRAAIDRIRRLGGA